MSTSLNPPLAEGTTASATTAGAGAAAGGVSSTRSPPLEQVSLLGDVGEWEHTAAPDEDDDNTAPSAQALLADDVARLSVLAPGSEAAADAARLAKMHAAAASASASSSAATSAAAS